MDARNKLCKEERLYLKKRIDFLFENARWLRSEHLRMAYLKYDELNDFPAQAMFSAPKRRFRRAVKRNLIKRRIRECYRLQKNDLYQSLNDKNDKVLIGFLYNSDEIAEFATLKKEVKSLLAQLTARI